MTGDDGLDKLRAVEFVAELRQVKSLVDGSVSIVLNLGEDCLPQAQVLLGWLQLQLRVVAEREKRGRDDLTLVSRDTEVKREVYQVVAERDEPKRSGAK